VTVSATAVPDVAIAAYRNGVMVGMSDATTSGAETFTLATTQTGARYVVVLTGFGATPGDYDVTISIR